MVYTCSGEADFVTLVFCLTVVYFAGHVFLAGRSVKIRAFDGLAGTCNALHCYFSAAKHREAAQWCEQGMKLLKHLGTLKSNYEQQVENSRCRQVGKI